MTLKECYETFGGDYEGTLGRMLNKESMLQRWVLKFLNDPNHDRMLEALANDQMSDLERATHSIKGTAMNLGFTRLGQLGHEVTEKVRAGEYEKAKEQAKTLTEEYNKVVGVIRAYQSELEG